MAPFFIVVMCFAVQTGTKCYVWSDDSAHYTRYDTAEACQAQVAKIESAIEALEKKQGAKAPPYVIGCKEVTGVTEGDRLDWGHT